MIEPIQVNNLEMPGKDLKPLDAEETEGKASFPELLKKEVSDVNQAQLEAEQLMEQLMAGKDVPREKVMIAARKAELSFKLLMEIRNQLTEAFDEIMRMQV